MTPAAYIPAKWQPHSPRREPIRVVVVHTTQPGTVQRPIDVLHRGDARSTARYFQTVDRPASAHVVIDPWEVIECVKPENEAVGAPGVNEDGYHIELYGFAEWDENAWAQPLCGQMLKLAGAWAGQVCKAHGLPAVFLSAKALKAGEKGLTGHKQASDAYHPGGHWDPGPAFPWDRFLGYVRENMGVHTDPPGPQTETARLVVDGTERGSLVDNGLGHWLLSAGGEQMSIRNVCAGLGFPEPTFDPGPPKRVLVRVK